MTIDIFRTPLALVFGVVVFAAATQTARADVIQTYTGKDFTSFSNTPPLTTLNFITGSFTFADALPEDMIYTDETATLVNWTITDGVDTLSQSAGNYLNVLAVETDASGDISGWDIQAFTSNACALSASISGCLHFISQGPPYPTYAYIDAVSDTIDVEGDYWQASVSGEPGTWSVTGQSTTPEPSTSVLASIGGAILLYTIRRKRQHRFRNTP